MSLETTIRNKELSLSSLLNKGHFRKLAYGKGINLFIIDTGVFIDLDKNYYGNGRSGEPPATLLSKAEEDYPLLVTKRVFEEIKDHRDKKMKINNRDEISQPTAVLANRLYDATVDFLDEIGYNKLKESEKDFHRLCVRLAANEAFNIDYRKGFKDRISEADIEMTSLALDLSICTKNTMNKVSAVNILSSDAHIARTINYLKQPNEDARVPNNNAISLCSFDDYPIRVIPSRGKLSSYMTK